MALCIAFHVFLIIYVMFSIFTILVLLLVLMNGYKLAVNNQEESFLLAENVGLW